MVLAAKWSLIFMMVLLNLRLINSASAQVPYYTPLGARSYAMGGAGSADMTSLANAGFNPALTPMIKGVQASSFYYKKPHPTRQLAEMTGFGGIAGMGLHFGEKSVWLGAGAAIGYAKFSEESNSHPDLSGYETENVSPHILLGIGFGYRDLVRVGLGWTIKQVGVKRTTATGQYDDEENLYDAGVLMAGNLLRYKGYTLGIAASFAYLNMRDFDLFTLTELRHIPHFRRYGANAFVSTPTWGRVDDFFDADLPVASLILNFDAEDTESRRGDDKRYGIGMEIGVFQMLFLRMGYIDDNIQTEGAKNPTYGVGIGLTKGTFRIRIDYARWPFDHNIDLDIYGLEIDLAQF